MSVQKLNSMLPQNKVDPVYYIIFEKYLQPKKPPKFEEKTSELLRFGNVQSNVMNLKQRLRTRWHLSFGKNPMRRIVQVNPVKNIHFSVKKNQRKSKSLQKLLPINSLYKNKDALTRRSSEETAIDDVNTGFDVYCQLASVHGFKNLVGASTWQRICWCFILCLLLVMSNLMVWKTIKLHADDPTILYIQSTTATIWGSSFPAVTLCNFNLISKQKVEELLQKDPQAEQILPHLHALLYNTLPVSLTPSAIYALQMYLDIKNYTHTEFLRGIAPDCRSQMLRCQLHGQMRSCSELFQRVETEMGFCCSFTYIASPYNNYHTEKTLRKHSNHFGYEWGLTVLIDPQVDDYYASRHKMAGYQIFTRLPDNQVSINSPHLLAFPRNEIHAHTKPLVTFSTPYVSWHSVQKRRCYISNEYKLFIFAKYSQTNCLSECRSLKMWDACRCVPTLWPRRDNWTVCALTQAHCVFANYENSKGTLLSNKPNYKIDQYSERFECNCYPTCDFSLYKTEFDVTPLDRSFSINNLELYRGIELKNHLVAHIFYADMSDYVMRLDVHNNWLTYFGVFGGITSLHLGYSFISGFEILFFLLVRPISNWLTRRFHHPQIKKQT